MSGYWRRILVANAVTAVAAFGLLGGALSGVPWLVRGRVLMLSFIYANCIGGIMAFVMPRLQYWFPVRRKISLWALRFAAIGVLTVAGCLVAGLVIIAVGMAPPRLYVAYLRESLWVSLLVATAGCLTVVAYETVRGELEATTVALRTKERDEAEARRLAVEAQLASLESRVEPHFLFNTLNSIAALVHDDPAAAERVVGQLASLMRSSLESTATPLVPLEQELGLVRDYLAIERVRFGDRLQYDIQMEDGLASVAVPRLSLQTLVENSVKYAVSPRRQGAAITVRAAAWDGRVRLQVDDNGPGFDASSTPAGHGLELLRSRVAMIFGDRGSLHIDSHPGRTSVLLEVPLYN